MIFLWVKALTLVQMKVFFLKFKTNYTVGRINIETEQTFFYESATLSESVSIYPRVSINPEILANTEYLEPLNGKDNRNANIVSCDS